MVARTRTAHTHDKGPKMTHPDTQAEAIYQRHNGNAYHCLCTAEQLAEHIGERWDVGATIATFRDGSALAISGGEVRAGRSYSEMFRYLLD